jgi:hypothetical protein
LIFLISAIFSFFDSLILAFDPALSLWLRDRRSFPHTILIGDDHRYRYRMCCPYREGFDAPGMIHQRKTKLVMWFVDDWRMLNEKRHNSLWQQQSFLIVTGSVERRWRSVDDWMPHTTFSERLWALWNWVEDQARLGIW